MSVSRVGPWRTLAFASVLVGLPISGCDCGTPVDPDGGTGIECGPGTIEEDGQCIPDPDNEPEGADGGPDLECGDGTVLNNTGTACVPDLDCPAGTTENEDGTGCVLDCENPFLYDEDLDSCVCALGLRPTEDGSDCEIDPALCGEGTLFQGGACVPIEPPPPADDDLNGGNPVVIELDDDKPVEVGGVVGPVDRVEGADQDVFTFTTTEAFTRVRIQLVSFGLPNGAFIVTDNESGIEVPVYQRVGLGGENRRAVRELTLPFAGEYNIIASDVNNLTGGLPVGGDDFDYALSIEILSAAPATAAAVDGTEYTGQHESVDAFRVETSVAPTGSILNPVLAGNDELDPDCNTFQLLWYVDSAGEYQEFEPDGTCTVNTLLPQPTGGVRFYVDYFARVIGPVYDYSLSINNVPVADGPQPNDGPIDGTTGGEDLSFFRMTAEANHVYRARAQLPTTTTLDADFFLVDASTLLIADQGEEVSVDGVDYLEIQFHVDPDEAGEYFLVIADAADDSPFEAPNYNVRFTLDDAEVEYTANPTVAGAAVENIETKPVANDWLGPWTMVRTDEIADLVVTTDSLVTYRAVSPATMAPLPFTTPTLDTEPLTVDEGTCAVSPVNELTASGLYEVTLVDAEDDFTTADSWDNAARAGADFFLRLPTQPAGTTLTIETLEAGDNVDADTTLAILEVPACDPDEVTRVAFNDDGGNGRKSLMTYEFTGDEVNLFLLVDSFDSASFPSMIPGTLQMRVEFSNDPEEVTSRVFRLAPGTRVLTQATGGDSVGDFTHTADAVESPFAWETEPNNASGTANPLPLDADPALNGFVAAGDFDWWAITVPEAGLLTVDAATGPLGLADAELTVAVVASDGTTELSSVTGFLDLTQSTYITTPGVYFASVGATEAVAAFDYTLNWSLDTDAPAPATCEAPRTVDGPGTYESTTAGVDVWADTGCLAEAGGFGSEPYDGVPDDVWSITVPAGSTIDLSATGAGDLAMALITDCENGDCLAAADATFPGFFDPTATEQIIYTNETSEALNALLIVTTFGNDPIEYTLDVNLVGATCFPGQSQCSDDGTALETCNDEGEGFDALACDAGCAFDDFEQIASCNAFCGEGTDKPAVDCNDDSTRVLTCADDQGRYEESEVCAAGCEVETDVDGAVTNAICSPFCGDGTDNPDSRCNGTVLETCAADQQSYEETQCAVECTDELDETVVVGGFCTFGLCNSLDSLTCATETFDGFGDVAVLRDCNDVASATVATACANGCNVDGTDCEPFAPVVNPITVTASTGTCDTPSGSSTVVTESGTFTVTLDATTGNDSDGLDCGLRPGNDVFLRLPGDRPAGSTVIVTAEGVDQIDPIPGADPVLAFFPDCGGTCLGRVDASGEAGTETSTYTYTGTEAGELIVVIDEFSDDPLQVSEVNVTVEFRDAIPTICDETDNTCDVGTNVLSACDDIGSELESEYCELGCPANGDARCANTCEAAVPEVLGEGTFSVDVEPYLGKDTLQRPCSVSGSQPEAIVAFTSTVTGSAFIDAETSPDIVLTVWEGNCTDEELYCGDFTESATIDVTAGETYFVHVENYSAFTTESPTTVEIEITEIIP